MYAIIQILELTPSQAQERLTNGALMLDVRELHEFQRWRVRGSHHIPLGEIEQCFHELPQDVEIVCICRTGRRSAIAQFIIGESWKNAVVYNLTGGIVRWVFEGFPIIEGTE